MTQKIALVTGATGFVGSHLTNRLVSEGWKVHVILRPSSTLRQLDSIKDKLVIHKHDGTMKDMLVLMELVKPDIVFHIASLFCAEHNPDHVSSLISSNILFGAQLVEAMVYHGVKRLINTGTSWQHYKNSDYNPVNLYAATKEAFETILQFYIETRTMNVITLKLFDVYGPGDFRPKLFALLNKARIQNKPLAMSPGEQLINLVYIDDVVQAYLIAERLLRECKVLGHQRYAVSSGNPVRLRDVVRTYEDVANVKLPLRWGGRPYRNREVMDTWSKGVPLPGWEVKTNLKDGIRKVVTPSEFIGEMIF